MSETTLSRRDAALQARLSTSRQDLEDRLGDLRRALDRELGTWSPKKAAWVVPLVGLACGLALAIAVKRRG